MTSEKNTNSNPEIRFSIVIPIYMVEKYLRSCVDSVLSQTYKNIEVILVDDGSPDGCNVICDNYAKSDERVRVIHKENGGLSSARNAGLELARGEYVIFLDSDDFYLESNFLEKAHDLISNHPCEAVFFKRRKYLESNGVFLPAPPPYHDSWYGQNCSQILLSLAKDDTLEANASMKITRRDFLLENELYFKDGLMSEDVEWFFRYAMHLKSVSLLDGAPYCYRIRKDSISHSITPKNINDLYYSISAYSDSIRNSGIECGAALLSYMSYQYYIVLGLCSEFMTGVQKSIFIKKCRQYKWLADYSLSPKTKRCSFLVKTLGIKISSIILGKYIKNK